MELTKEMISQAYRKVLDQNIREQDSKVITSFAEALFDEFKTLSTKETVNNSLVEMIHAYIDSITDYKNDSVILSENTFDRLNIMLYSLGIPLPDNVKRQTTLKEPVTLKCDLCKYTGTETNPVGECPKCNWDELSPAPDIKRGISSDSIPAHISKEPFLLDTINSGCCTLAGPGRGDCENTIGLPGISVPGQHDGLDNTVDAHGKPNGWCWQCWKSKQITLLQEQIAASNKTIESTIESYELKFYDFEKNELFLYQINDPTSSVTMSKIIESINERLHQNMIYVSKLKMFTPEELLDEKIISLKSNLETLKALLFSKEYTPEDLQSIELYRMQMAGICTAATGHWKEGDSSHPDYMTPALKDVARLYSKYDELYKLCEKHNLVGCHPADTNDDLMSIKDKLNTQLSAVQKELEITLIELQRVYSIIATKELHNQSELPLSITEEYIDEICGDPEKAHYTVFPNTFHTVCCIKLPNGATMLGESVCAASKIFNEKLGREYAFKQAKEKVWQFEGYALCEKRYQAGLEK